MGRKYFSLPSGGYDFVFKYDREDPELLHIYARHLTDPGIAVQTWFEGEKEVWNVQFNHYETSSELYTVYWFWLKESKAVMIISCFRR